MLALRLRMGESFSRLVICILAAALAQAPQAFGDEPATRSATKSEAPAAQDLTAFLKAKGYFEVPLTRNKLGLFNVDVKVNGQSFVFILDSGAGNIVIDSDAADRLKLIRQKTGHLNAGIGGAIALEIASNIQVSVGQCGGQFTLSIGSLAYVNEELKKAGDKPCAGLLGFPFLKLNGAVIDYPSEKLLLMGPAASIASVFESSKASVRLAVSINRKLENYEMSFNVQIKVVNEKPELVTYENYGQIQNGMNYAKVGALLGGNLDKCNLVPGFSGAMSFQQAKNRINLTLRDGKITGKSFEAAE